MKRLTLLAALAALPASAYYGFLHYSANGLVAPEKFDLAALPGKTITFYVSDNGPASYTGTDSFVSVLAQISQATKAWNGISGSDLRVAFGGLYTPGTPQNGPAAEVVFEDLPPGLLGYGGPLSRGTLNATDPANPFFPVTLAAAHLSRDLTKSPGPSYSDIFHLVTVHELGHALGLQHTFTSAAMSTIPTRATSVIKPVDADDAAGLAQLYPTAAFRKATGTITGQITFPDGSPVHMASVVAIRSGAPAVSALTLPDGTFQITGVPPGQYFLYAHALPPDADIVSPLGADGKPVAPSGAFSAAIYPGVTNFLAASAFSVVPGKTTPNINLAVKPRSSVPIYSVSLYSFFGTNAVRPADFNATLPTATVVGSGAGLGSNGAATPGLNVQIMGGSASVYGIRPYAGGAYTYLALDLRSNPVGAGGPQHVVFSTPDYLYVLPSGMNVVHADAPTVTSVTPNSDGSVALTGTNFAKDSLFYFDGLPGTVQSVDPVNGAATVTPPLGAAAQTATVNVYNGDGQSSLFYASAAPVTYSFAATAAPSISLATNTLPAGVEAEIEITGTNTNFTQGVTTVGFGSSDIFVRRVFVLSPTRLRAEIRIAPGAALASTEVTVMTNFQLASLPNGFQIQAAVPNQPSVYPQLFNAVPGQTGSYSGAVVTLYGANLLAVPDAKPVVTIGSEIATILYASPTQINLIVPNLASGNRLLQVFNGSDTSYPVALNIDPAPAVITAANVNGTLLDILLTGFGAPGATIDPSRVRVNIGGLDVTPGAITANGGVTDVQIALPAALAAGPQNVIVYLDGLSSTPFSAAVTAH